MNTVTDTIIDKLTMPPEEREEVAAVAAKIQMEQDSKIFVELVTELNDLLERKERRLLAREQTSSA